MNFADGQPQAPVLEAIKAAEIPSHSGKHFKFNNSALFAKESKTKFDEACWEMCLHSFTVFFLKNFQKQTRLTANRRLVSSVGRATVCCAGGRGFEPQTGRTLRVLKLRRTCCLCNFFLQMVRRSGLLGWGLLTVGTVSCIFDVMVSRGRKINTRLS